MDIEETIRKIEEEIDKKLEELYHLFLFRKALEDIKKIEKGEKKAMTYEEFKKWLQEKFGEENE